MHFLVSHRQGLGCAECPRDHHRSCLDHTLAGQGVHHSEIMHQNSCIMVMNFRILLSLSLITNQKTQRQTEAEAVTIIKPQGCYEPSVTN